MCQAASSVLGMECAVLRTTEDGLQRATTEQKPHGYWQKNKLGGKSSAWSLDRRNRVPVFRELTVSKTQRVAQVKINGNRGGWERGSGTQGLRPAQEDHPGKAFLTQMSERRSEP